MDYDLQGVRELLRSLFTTPDTIEGIEERADLVRALDTLGDRDQRALILRAMGYRYSEIAQRLGAKRAEYIVKRAERRLVAALSQK